MEKLRRELYDHLVHSHAHHTDHLPDRVSNNPKIECELLGVELRRKDAIDTIDQVQANATPQTR